MEPQLSFLQQTYQLGDKSSLIVNQYLNNNNMEINSFLLKVGVNSLSYDKSKFKELFKMKELLDYVLRNYQQVINPN